MGKANIHAQGGGNPLSTVCPKCSEHPQLATMPARVVDGHGQASANGHGEEEGEGGEGTESANAGQHKQKGKGGCQENPKQDGQAKVKPHWRLCLAVPATQPWAMEFVGNWH